MTESTLDAGQLAAAAADVLRRNDAGTMTRAAPQLYPHQWSWDAAFIAVGLAHLDVRRACIELDSLFAGQWRTGMVPHIVFDPARVGYFPGPDRWACAQHTADAPAAPATSGICQPPVHALAVERIAQLAGLAGGSAAADLEAWLPTIYPRLRDWHRYLARHRDPTQSGLLTIYHGWESGMDNSPRWDRVYSRIVVGESLPAYQRRDTTIVTDLTQRPTQVEYDRYLWIVEELKQAGYDDERIRASVSFLTTDVFMSAIFAAANDALAAIAHLVGAAEVHEFRGYADRFRAGVAASVDAITGLCLDTDLRSGDRLAVETVAGFSPLLCGGLDVEVERQLEERLASPDWLGYPQLAHRVLPSTSPTSADFRPRAYWRGPSWPVANWLFTWMLDRRGRADLAAPLRAASLEQLAEGSLAEYYEPITNEPLGSRQQSWTAAAALDLLAGGRSE